MFANRTTEWDLSILHEVTEGYMKSKALLAIFEEEVRVRVQGNSHVNSGAKADAVTLMLDVSYSCKPDPKKPQ